MLAWVAGLWLAGLLAQQWLGGGTWQAPTSMAALAAGLAIVAWGVRAKSPALRTGRWVWGAVLGAAWLAGLSTRTDSARAPPLPPAGLARIDAQVERVRHGTDAQARSIVRVVRGARLEDDATIVAGTRLWAGPAPLAEGTRVRFVGKVAPFDPDDWGQMVRDVADRTTRCGFFPVISVMLGLPGETPDDVTATLKLVQDLAAKGAVIFPIFYEPMASGEAAERQRFTLAKMTPGHLELYRTCYEQNFKMVPRLFWDNQRAGGVSWARRALMQTLGRGEVMTWRRTFRALRRRMDRSIPVAVEKEQVYAS